MCVPKQISFSAHYFTLNQFLSSVNYTLRMFLKCIQFLDLISFTLILATIICHLGGSENGITDAMNMNLGKLWGMVRDREAWHAAVHGVTRSWTRLGNWTTAAKYFLAGHLFSSFMLSHHSPYFSQNKIWKFNCDPSSPIGISLMTFGWRSKVLQFVSHIINWLMPYLSPFGSTL